MYKHGLYTQTWGVNQQKIKGQRNYNKSECGFSQFCGDFLGWPVILPAAWGPSMNRFKTI